MKKFVFELQSLEDIKKRDEEREKNELGRIQSRINEFHNRLDTLELEMHSTKQDFKTEVRNPLKSFHFNRYDNYIKKISEKKKIQQEKIKAENKIKEACLDRLMEIQKELKVLDKLKQRKLEEYRLEEKRQEEKLLDDIISYKITVS